MSKPIDELHEFALSYYAADVVEEAIEALYAAYRALVESGQLEVNPPKALTFMFEERSKGL